MSNSLKPSDFRDPSEYKEILFDMFLAYVRSEGFGSLSTEQRIHAADCVDELNMLVSENNKK